MIIDMMRKQKSKNKKGSRKANNSILKSNQKMFLVAQKLYVFADVIEFQ